MTIDLYARYRQALDNVTPPGPFAPYDWMVLPDVMGPEALVYGQMAPDFARELANTINQLSQDVRRLRAWARVCGDLTDLEKLEASGEFIDPLATFALNAPYALKAKFAFAAAHLCHQADVFRLGAAWCDDLPPDIKIDWSTADAKGTAWKRYGKFKEAAAPVDGTKFRNATDNFRNTYAHRFSSRVLIGITQPVTRTVAPNTGRVRYGIGGREPLDLNAIANLLASQVDHALSAFGRFQMLVAEQTALIEPARTA